MNHDHPKHPSNVPAGDPRSMPANGKYRDNYDRIFKKKEPKQPVKKANNALIR